MIVYATQDQQVIYGDHQGIHKNGRVPLGEPLTVITEVEGWYEVVKPAHYTPVISEYPKWFVQKSMVSAVNPNPAPEPSPSPTPGDLTDAEIAKFVRWYKGA
jgi:2,4-dienoyl-CoA reductase-like NADH-dependent reductase (Old Yellow Enzyme family)